MTLLDSRSVIELASGPLATEYGEFHVRVLTDGQEECMVATKGHVQGGVGVLCRMHSECICSHVLFSTECDCSAQMRKALEAIAVRGQGLVILLSQEGRSNGSAAHIATQELKRRGMSQDDAYRYVGFPADSRNYRLVAKALSFLGVQSIKLLSSSLRKKRLLEDSGVAVELLSARAGELTLLGPSAANLVAYQQAGDYSEIVTTGQQRRILVVGDLCVDYVLTQSGTSSQILDLPEPSLGGTALNACRAFSASNTLLPILYARTGDDPEGVYIRKALQEEGITSLVGLDRVKRTGVTTLIYGERDGSRIMIKSEDAANDYSLDDLGQAVTISGLRSSDFVFLICHFLVRVGLEQSRRILEKVSSQGSGVVLDLVPHNMHDSVSSDDFLQFMSTGVLAIVSEYATLAGLCGLEPKAEPSGACIRAFSTLKCEWLVLRFGDGNCGNEKVLRRCDDLLVEVDTYNTGYGEVDVSRRKGFGDRLTRVFFENFLMPSA